MATFCGNCGSTLGTNIAFCPHCGSAAANRPNPVAGPQTAPSSGVSLALKVVIVLLCCLLVGGLAVVGGVIYMAHRVKQAVVQKAAENGVDLDALTTRNTAHRMLPKPCDVLTKEEISHLIDEPIERAEPKDAMCLFYAPAGLSARLAEANASDALKSAQTAHSKTDGTDIAHSMDQLVNSVNRQTDGGDQPLLMLALDADGQAQMAAVSASKAILGSLGRSASDSNQKGRSFGSDVPGLGDKAIWIPKLGLNILQGGVLIRIIPGPIPDADAKTIAVALAVLPKI